VRRPIIIFSLAVLFACGGMQTGVASYNFTILRKFDRSGHFATGFMPSQGVDYDPVSNALYGTTEYGGNSNCHQGNGCGVVFALTPDAHGQLTGFRRLHVFDFHTKGGKDGDGGDAVVLDPAGNLYGTSQMGGDYACSNGLGCGIVYMLEAPLFQKGMPKERILHVFEDSDGRAPYGGLVLDPGSGALYGTTFGGGSAKSGTVFRLTPNPSKTKWNFTVLYNFSGRPDAGNPVAPLITDGHGRLFGTSEYGGRGKGFGEGTMFSLQSYGGGWKERLGLRFSLKINGEYPFPGLTPDGQGNFFAATGANCGKHLNKVCGYALELMPQGKTYGAQILHAFYWADGSTLYGSALSRDASGDLFGVAAYGGAHGNGSAYELVNAAGAYTFVKLYDFCALSGCSDGAIPFGLSSDASGNLYGTTIAGGIGDNGEVFMLSPAR